MPALLRFDFTGPVTFFAMMKILHLEDDPRDVELAHAVFREEWPDCRISVAASRDEFRTGLAAGDLDLILSDFNLKAFDGLQALQLAREHAPSVPFIFLSGTIGEDRAVEAMREGATDYVIKDRPKRLVLAVKRALDNVRHLRERRAAEEQLLRVQRLESLGMLAAGIAHDFNNVLAPVLLAVPLLRERLDQPLERQLLNSVESSVERGAGLVREILGFAQGVTGEPQLLQAKHLLRDLVGVIRQTFPPSIQIAQTIASDLWPLKANPTQLHQVLLNLCVNARDAMPDGGTLTLRAANRLVDETSAAAVPGMHAGAYLLFEVADTGTGIPPEILSRIWEPFFTTKDHGSGTGLGLSTVRAIVENHRGIVTVHSRAGRGTTFQVYFPAAPGVELAPVPVEDGSARPRGNGELILVVDDDPSIREVACAVLVRHGYRALAAADGTEAVALFAPRCLEIRAVVTDLSMPVLDGLALIKVIRNLNPSVRVLAMSGQPDQQDRFLRQQTSSPFLMKPFSSDALLEAIQSLLRANDIIAAAS